MTGPIITSTNKRVQDATVALLDFIYQHLEGSKNHARPAFCGLLIVLEHRAASPFGTEACWALDTKIIGWILHFLTDRSLTSTSMAVSSLLSYTSCILMTHTNENHNIKFADDTVLLSPLKEDDVSHVPCHRLD